MEWELNMKIAIVDDDLIFAQSFKKMLKDEFKAPIQLLDIFLSAENFSASDNKYDLVFLDIDMPGMSGLEFAKENKHNTLSIVFVTNRDDLVFEAYNTTNTLGFVRKSDLEEDLLLVFDRLKRESQSNMHLNVKSGTSLRKIKYSEILYVEKVSHNVILHTLTDYVTMRKTITEVESLLTNRGFVRTHIGFLVNMTHIKLIDANSVKLSNGESVPISRQNAKLVKDKFMRWSVMLNE